MPSAATATNDFPATCWSPSNALRAAACPAWSPSKTKISSPRYQLSSIINLRSIARWSSPKAVPHEATAVVTPAKCIAITSV
ncbi:Uncharacterised protein [Mycobacterium tuberculosis]|nr:Uncharacterised protein [Mycobacterium tuberculosis]